VQDETQVGDSAVLNAGDELAVGAEERIVQSRDKPPAITVSARLRIEGPQTLKRLSHVQVAAGEPGAVDDVDRVWVDRGWGHARIVARARKAAESGELAPDPVTAPGDVRVGAEVADAAARWAPESTREVSEGDGAVVRLPVPDQLPEPEASLVDPNQVQARVRSSRCRPDTENAKTEDRDEWETHTHTCSAYRSKEQALGTCLALRGRSSRAPARRAARAYARSIAWGTTTAWFAH